MGKDSIIEKDSITGKDSIIVGILGRMGLLATAYFYQLIIKHTFISRKR